MSRKLIFVLCALWVAPALFAMNCAAATRLAAGIHPDMPPNFIETKSWKPRYAKAHEQLVGHFPPLGREQATGSQQ